MDGSSFNVIINRHDLSTSVGESIPRKTELVHPGYNKNTMDNDYALVFLSRATTQKVDFIKLNQDEAYPAAVSTSRTMGWGTTSSGGSSSDVLREVNLPIISNQLCDQKYPHDSIFATNICTFEPGKDSCQGDSGASLFFLMLSSDHICL
jgi:secreted trypsin-like serine protease